MSLHKQGTPYRIEQVATTADQFEQLKHQIAEDNNLVRCACGQLLAKFSCDNKTINIQRKGLDVIAEASSAQIKCPSCKQVNRLQG